MTVEPAETVTPRLLPSGRLQKCPCAVFGGQPAPEHRHPKALDEPGVNLIAQILFTL